MSNEIRYGNKKITFSRLKDFYDEQPYRRD